MVMDLVDAFRIGDRVRDKTYGDGVVIDILREFGYPEYIVRLDNTDILRTCDFDLELIDPPEGR